MAIRPVSVSFYNNYNNLAFEGRKKKNSEQSRVSSPVKAVPLAVLLAMSPLNAQKAFALEPESPKIENVTGLNETQQAGRIPMPSNWTVLKNIGIDFKAGMRYEFNLIDTDNDKSNFEILEFTNIGANGDIVGRGILKAVKLHDDEKEVTLYGIKLNPNDRRDYSPQKGLLTMTLAETMYNTLKSVVQMKENNSAFVAIPRGFSYNSISQIDKRDYNAQLGIK